jgi:hypothetical protein
MGAHQPCAFTGVVTYIGQEAEFPPQNVPKEDERAALSFAVRLQIDNAHYLLKPGMSAEAHFSDSTAPLNSQSSSTSGSR